MSNTFFDESTEQSQIKTAIVSKYFWVWAKVILKATGKPSKIAYIDLFAGPGRYKDGTMSTPLRILISAIREEKIRDALITVFNDKDENNSQTLEREIQNLPGITTLKYKPQIYTGEVGTEIVKLFESRSIGPTLFFVDPWGYKGLSLKLINSVLKDWGCDCIFFFNYNRINMGLSNKAVHPHMNALFGEGRAEQLHQILKSMPPYEHELTIVEEISQTLRTGITPRYVLPFCFKNDKGTRTSHHLIFVSKHFKGYEIMKGIMAKESSSFDQGVPTFIYSPATERQPLLFELVRPLGDLEEILLQDYAGKTITMRKIYENHSVGKRYIEKTTKMFYKS
ncbi:three-Cys-motif partner protein TcmP [Anthocerotibacter panamensis]|uniref:three-Cys-motif partner protein TcmP n=1 Tax=Anthocerotibacter panamensis TaxID=2857077 RepID=UPI001C401C8B|nr:three-Cys-motif partner protein TcmP [Anthocerotibacter panamensis]